MAEDEVRQKNVKLERWIDARYRGQSFELRVPARDWVNAFHRAHEIRYGYSQPEARVEAVTLRVSGTADAPAIPERRQESSGDEPRPAGQETVYWRGESLAANRYVRDELRAGQHIAGPAIVTEYSSTTWLPPGWNARMDRLGNLVVTGARRGTGRRSARTGGSSTP
jgi:N-methylhydantoinase A